MHIDLNQAWRMLPPDFPSEHFWENTAQALTWPALSTPLLHQENFWAACPFHMPANDFCAAWWLECLGIQGRYHIWLNGQKVAQGQGLGLKFRVDVTHAVGLDDNWLLVAFEGDKADAFLGWTRPLHLQAYPCEANPSAEAWLDEAQEAEGH